MDKETMEKYLLALGSFLSQQKDSYWMLRRKMEEHPEIVGEVAAPAKLHLDQVKEFLEKDLTLHELCDLIVVSHEKTPMAFSDPKHVDNLHILEVASEELAY